MPASSSPVEVIVSRQLEAYNRQDVDAFVACFSPDVEIVRDGSPDVQHGRETMRQNYAAMFARFPQNQATVTQRMVVGQHAVDEELVEGRDGPPFRTIAVYTITAGLISHVRFLSCENT
ncbi:nuclear transport factor 2 family protein [Synoicihabitans lomoniglobus]|uniref:Nuclear transport factor 2 family protein n=1 Tax=Synoicihabitans lomoniglobus TaxID=2909285 RepID=A0AAF0A0M3_9BACT|nr:nuclear transport factor 2 family protein [Opitutaceae bacterium LMO-M01]WED64327.1 nuclear transport factor 2 family protein [Opitutaceae bacterium LMO-M01]